MRIPTLLVACFACVAADGVAQSTPRPLTRHIEFWNPDWSPDGKTIVFESTLDGNEAIYTIGVDGTRLTRLTDARVESVQPKWSPDGSRIVFGSDRGGHGDIYVMNADGSAQTRVTSMPSGMYYQASFSPNGRWIAFQGRPNNSETRDRVYIVGVDGTGFRQLSDSSYGAEGPRWSADGQTVTFRQVPYPKRLWEEMGEADMRVANAGARHVSIRLDGSGLTPVTQPKAAPRPDAIPDDAERSPTGKHYAYNKDVGGWAGLYVYDVAAKSERMVAGGPGAGPVGYIRTSALTAITDTIDTFESLKSGGPIRRGNGAYVIRTVRRVGAETWEISDAWYDSTSKLTARQASRTARGSLKTELETVRADVDSASLLVSGTRVTGWVVPAGKTPTLFDGNVREDRFAAVVVMSAIAKSKPAVGKVFHHPTSSLYGGNPLETRTDSMRVVRRDTLTAGTARLPALVIERIGGSMFWLDETTGAEIASRGNAGPERYWWHVRRGVTPPAPR